MTIGFRVKSGFAVAVMLSGRRQSPVAAGRAIVRLSDPALAETRQPYHSAMGEAEEDQRIIAKRTKVIERIALASIAALLQDAGDVTGAALVVGSTIDPAKVGNQHIRAHANEGRLFRAVIEDALRAHGVGATVIVQKQLPALAAKRLDRSAAQIDRVVAGFGEALGRPWRADEKAAALAAWVAL